VKRTWVFLKLRLLQLVYDKTSLFFGYVLPVLLLLGIGYPQQMKGKPSIEVAYSDRVQTEASAAFVRSLQSHTLVQLKPYAKPEVLPARALEANEVKHYLELNAAKDGSGGFVASLFANSLPENQVENTALRAILDGSLAAFHGPTLQAVELPTNHYTSYIVTLLPGVIGLTLLIIGLNGFGAVLIEEKHHGLHKNIKSIDASPLPFLAGLFISRLLVAYSVAVGLFLISILVFNVPTHISFPALLLVVTLGCVAFLGLGLLLATVSPSVNAFNGIVNFVEMPLIILGGVFFSVSTFPGWMQTFARLMPLTQLNIAIRELLFNAVGFNDLSKIAPEIAGLSAWSILTLVLARLRFKW